MKVSVLAALVGALFLMTACNTATGVARDTWGAARYVGGKVAGGDD